MTRAERRAGHRPEAGGLRQAQTVRRDCLCPASVRKPARIPRGAEPGHKASCGRFVPGEGLGREDQRGLPGRPTYPSVEGPT